MRDWKKFQTKIKQAFAKDGVKAKLIKETFGSYNMTTGKKTKSGTESDTVYILFKTSDGDHEEMIPSDQSEVMCSYSKKLDPTDTENVKLVYNGITYKTINARSIRPGGEVLFYKLKVVG